MLILIMLRTTVMMMIDDDDDDCIIIDTRTGEPVACKPDESDTTEKEPNCVSQGSVDNEVTAEPRFVTDCSAVSGKNETQTPPQTHSEELNSGTVGCTGELECHCVETNAVGSDVSLTSCLVPEKTGSKSCFNLVVKEQQQPVDADLSSVIDVTEDLRTEASVVEGSQEGNRNGAERENPSRNTDEFDAGLFLPMKEVWSKDIKAEVLDGACAYSDGLCDTSLYHSNCKTYDSTILDLPTNQSEVDDTNGPIKYNHLSTNHVASSGCSGNRTPEQVASSASHTASVLSVVDVIHPPEFSLATPVQVDLSTAQ